MKKQSFAAKTIIKNILYPILGMALFFAVWAVASAAYGNKLILPDPAATATAAFRLLGLSDFWVNICFSLLRALAAFAFSFVISLALAVFTTVFDLKKLFAPIVTIIRAVPTVAVIMLIFLWSDLQATPIIVASLVVFPVLYSAFLATLSSANKDLIETTKVFGYGKMGAIRFVYLPALRKSVVEGTASGLSLSLKVVISAEIIVLTKNSLGVFIVDAKQMIGYQQVLAAALVTVVLCIVIEFAVRIPLSRPYFNN